MKEPFSLKFVLDNKIQIIKLTSMEQKHHLELNFEDGIYKPPSILFINDVYYFLPISEEVLHPDLRCFTYDEGIESFGDYLLSELNISINKVKHSK